MKGFRFVIYFLVLFLVECKGEKPVFHPKESYVSFKIIQNDFPNIIHSINYGYDFVNDILFYRKSFLDTVIYIIDTKTSQIDSILTPVFNKSSLIVIDKDCFVLDFITKSTPANSETVLYKIIGKKVIKVNSFNYTNDKGYPEIDIFKQLNDSELVACDFNNNIIYNLSWNSTPIFHSTIISADSLESIGKFKWSDNVISIESLDTLDSIVVRKNQLSIDFKEKYCQLPLFSDHLKVEFPD